MKKAINFIFAIGAAIVILGAAQKILHNPGADFFLQLGLYTEVAIFTVMGFQELFEKQSSGGIPEIKLPEGHIGDSWELNESINNLNNTIKKVFNQ